MLSALPTSAIPFCVSIAADHSVRKPLAYATVITTALQCRLITWLGLIRADARANCAVQVLQMTPTCIANPVHEHELAEDSVMLVW